jgi:two-component system, OmpR family, sensor histidine kinase KdpD
MRTFQSWFKQGNNNWLLVPGYLLRDSMITLASLFFTSVFCKLLYHHGLDESVVIMLFLTTIICISRFTDGYLYGIVSSLIAVLLFNYLFTEPYFSLNFYNPKYPMIFAIMLAVSLLVSTMMVQIRKAADERVRLAMLQESSDREIKNEKLRSTILYSLSHDLRTPLTSISGSASMLLEGGCTLSESDKEHLVQEIYDESIWLNQFVENLLSLARINESLLRLNLKSEVLDEVVGETVRLIRRRLNGRMLQVSTPSELVMADMDFALIEQVIINLVDNSVAHTPPDGQIGLSVEVSNLQLIFRISNNGPALAPDVMEKLYDRYFVGSEQRFDTKRGMGLGLHICQAIVKAHGGTIRAANRPEGGVEFAFTIPMHGGVAFEPENDRPDH